MADVFLIRKNGGEALGASVSAFTGIDTAYFESFTPASKPDGIDLATPKIKDGTKLRNATSGEITGFPAKRTADDIAVRKTSYKNMIDDKLNGAIWRAICKVIADGTTGTKAQIIAAVKTAIDAGA